jgi:glyoxylase-like metal-dependent hydrolase (beta-lactamase superfamily II)
MITERREVMNPDNSTTADDRTCSPSTGFSCPRPHYSWRLLRAGPFRLDGGSMFGVVPRVVWEKRAPADELGRITAAHNCLLLERRPDDINLAEGACEECPHRVVIEAGSGDKLDAKTRAIYGLNDQCVETAIEQAGVSCDDIDDLILSHLHFDHCGGATRRVRKGESPDWVAAGGDPATAGVKLTFPSATIFVQRREWEDALINRSHMTRTYLRENIEPLRDRVKLLDAPAPFPEGYLPARDESPPEELCARKLEALPGIFVFRVPGHTWGQQAVMFHDDLGRTVVFTPDVLPTVNHVGAAYNMAYDVEPYMSTITRRWFLEEAVKGNWLLALDHEPGNPLCRVKRDGKGWYELTPEQE